MIEFTYKARDKSGLPREGIVQALSRSFAAAKLRERGMVVLGLAPVTSQDADSSSVLDFRAWFKPNAVDVELSLQQLAMMLRGGMNLLTALNLLSSQAPKKSLAQIWDSIANDIQTGDSLSIALKNHDCFPDFVVQLIKVGERTGELSPVIERAVRTMRGRRKGTQEITSALIYPFVVLLMAMGVTAYMVVYLIPRLEIYLQSLGKDIPAMTQTLVHASVWLRQWYAIGIIVLTGFLIFTFVVYRSEDGRMWVDRWLLRIPVIGSLLRLCETSTFARSLSIMLGSGITLIDGLGTVQDLLFNRFTARTVNHARDRIIQGDNFADAIETNSSFSPMLKKMIAVGQQSGDLRGVLHEVADFHEEQFSSQIKRLNAVITPALTVGVGSIVGYVYIAFFMALLAAGN